MPKPLEPRKHPAPEKFADYVQSIDEADLAKLGEDIFVRMQKEVTPRAAIEMSVEDGWDKEFCDWLVHFTYAQRRPIQVFYAPRFVPARLSEQDKQTSAMWSWGALYFIGWGALFSLAGLLGHTTGPLLVVYLLFCGYRFFASWADRKGYTHWLGLLSIFPPAAFVLMALIPDKDEVVK